MRLLILVVVLLSLLVATGAAILVQPFVRARTSAPPAVDASRLEAHVRALSAGFFPRSFDHPEQLDAAASYIHAQFLKAGAKVDVQPYRVAGVTYRNVIARYGPDAGPLLVIGAHYDTFSEIEAWGAPRSGDLAAHTPGADDNASGVAGLIELARLLGRSPPRIAVELVAYTLEEPPHFHSDTMGSAHHARRLRKSGRDVALMISLEMIGYFSAAPRSQQYPFTALGLFYPDRGDFIAAVGRIRDWPATRKVKAAMLGASDLPVFSINSPAFVPGVDFSDHRSYWNEGFPALMVTDTAFYRNPHYHQSSDTADRLDYASMAKVVRGVYAVVQSYSADLKASQVNEKK
ncbi:MAG: M28 family peptidase [Sulfurifustis sp.]